MKQNTFDRRWVSSTLADVISFSTVEIFIYYYIQQLLTRLCFLKINHRFVGLIRCWSLGLFALFSIDACFQFWSKRYFMLLTAFFLPPTEQIESESLSKNHLVHAINCITLEFTWIRSEWNSLPSHASFHSWNYHVDFAECAVVGWIADELHRILSPTKK